MRTVMLMVAALTAAVSTARAAEPGPSLAGSEWGFPDAGDVFIQFAETTVAGFSGCNRFRGPYTFANGTLTLGPLAITRMACPEDRMETERRVLRILDETAAASRTNTVLILKDGTGADLATLNRRDFD